MNRRADESVGELAHRAARVELSPSQVARRAGDNYSPPMIISNHARRFGAALLVAACSKSAPPATPPPPEVRVVTVGTEPIANVIELPGRLQAVRTAEVRARVDGIVQRRLYTEGTDVREGQPLFAIDPRELRARSSTRRRPRWRARRRRRPTRRRTWRATRDSSRSRRSASRNTTPAVARLRTAEADVAQRRAQLAAARLSLGYTTVTAPISGRAGRAEVTEGALVSAGAGTLLTRIEQLDPIYANFSQSSSDVLALRNEIASGALQAPALRQVAVRLVLEDGSAYRMPGRSRTSSISRIDEATGTAALRAEFPNPQRTLAARAVRARARRGRHAPTKGLRVPQRAVTVTPQGGERAGRRREGRRREPAGEAGRAAGRLLGHPERAAARRARHRRRPAEGGSRASR